MQRDSACSSLVSTDESSGNIISRWPLCYPVYQFTCADMDGDGVDDILAGVVKTTRFDTVLRKRIFVFKLVDGYIRPMWLGSRMGHPVEDFGVVTAKPLNMLRTIELEQDGRYLVADYRWKGFGFSFVQYQLRNSSLEEARKLLPAKTYNDETH